MKNAIIQTFILLLFVLNSCRKDESYTLPILSTNEVTNISFSGATCGGNITSDGGAKTISRGICWNTIGNPTILDFISENGTGIGNFTCEMNNLIPITTYYVRAFATNSVGTEYGNTFSFTTSAEIITDIDGNIYHTIRIGTQIWMLENLTTTKFRNGELIETTNPATLPVTGDNNGPYQWAYNGNETNAGIYGRLYSWNAVIDSRFICPVGWHIPSEAEWTILTEFLGGEEVAGGKIKESGSGLWTDPNTGATNTSGFKALPAGIHAFNTGEFQGLGKWTGWWSSTERNLYGVYCRYLNNDFAGLYTSSNYTKEYAYSIRCIRD